MECQRPTQHAEELKMFISTHNIDVMLISDTLHGKNLPKKISKYSIYHINHPASTARGGTAIIIKNSIKHHELSNYSQDFLQASSVKVEDTVGPLTILAVYLTLKHKVKQEELENFFNTLGHLFIAGGDHNAKHTDCGYRLISPRGRLVHKTV
jgi:hypothetical protein